MSKNRNIVVVVARLIVGVLFLFSAGAKVVDPYGTVLKMEEYLVAMGLGGLWAVAPVATVALIAAEMALGWATLWGRMGRVIAPLTALLAGFFLLLTFWVAVWEPVAECGCFGDVVPMGPWTTFAKNVVVMALTLLCLWGSRREESRGSLWGTAVVGVATVALSCYWLWALPAVDMFPFGVGADLKIIEPADQGEEVYVICRDKTTGERVRLALSDESWWNDERLEYVEVEEAVEPNVPAVRREEFLLYDAEGVDVTDTILWTESCTLLCVERAGRLTERKADRLSEIAAEAEGLVVVVTASPLDVARERVHIEGAEWCNMDPVVMRALLRAPVGVVRLQEGVIVSKQRK